MIVYYATKLLSFLRENGNNFSMKYKSFFVLIYSYSNTSGNMENGLLIYLFINTKKVLYFLL